MTGGHFKSTKICNILHTLKEDLCAKACSHTPFLGKPAADGISIIPYFTVDHEEADRNLVALCLLPISQQEMQ